jgi:mannose-1-phosphate guanylyltransferase
MTAFLPKPLLPVRGRSVAARTLEQLAAAGCEAVAVNLFHQGPAIREALGDAFANLPIVYSQESTLLGTLGALGPLRDFLADTDPIVVVNGDSLCRWPIRQLVRRHLRSGAQATLLLSKRADPEAYGGGVGVDSRHHIVAFRSESGREGIRQRVFMGAHVLSRELLSRVPDGPADFVTDLYGPILREGGRIAAVESGRRWHDLGTPERYREGVLDWGRRRGWISKSATIASSARVHRAVVEERGELAPSVELTRSVMLPRARLGRGCRIRDSIIGPDVALPPRTALEHRMVTLVRADAPGTDCASVVGGLVYEPI